jgi:ATP-dependent RNA helicase DeaD
MKKEILGKIDLREMNTWVEVDKASAGKLIKAIDGKRYNNRTIRMNEADGGYRKPTDEGRKKTYQPRERRSY